MNFLFDRIAKVFTYFVFKEKDGYVITLNERIRSFKDLSSSKEHFKDAIELRTLTYFKDRFNREEVHE